MVTKKLYTHAHTINTKEVLTLTAMVKVLPHRVMRQPNPLQSSGDGA